MWVPHEAATSILALVVSFAAAAEPVSESTRYLEQADLAIQAGNYVVAANALNLALASHLKEGIEPSFGVLMRHAETSFLAGHHAAAADVGDAIAAC